MSTSVNASARAHREHRLLLLLHWVNLGLVGGITGLGAYRTWGLNAVRMNRMDIVPVTAGAKSIAFLIYILLTAYVFKSAYSPITVLVMSAIDTVLWLAALGVTAYGIVQIPPSGTRATLTYALIALLAIAFILSLPILYFAYRQYKHAKIARQERSGRGIEVHREPSMEK